MRKTKLSKQELIYKNNSDYYKLNNYLKCQILNVISNFKCQIAAATWNFSLLQQKIADVAGQHQGGGSAGMDVSLGNGKNRCEHGKQGLNNPDCPKKTAQHFVTALQSKKVEQVAVNEDDEE